MFIPQWLIWTLGIIIWLGIVLFVGKTRGDYDFFSPVLGAGIFFIGLAFILGFLISHC